MKYLANSYNKELFISSIPKDFNIKLKAISESDIGKIDATIVFSKYTPKIFQILGLPNLPVEMYVDKLARGLFLEDSEKHGHKNSIDKNIIKDLSRILGNPIAIFTSATVKNSLVALYDIEDKNGNWIMVSLVPNKEKSNSVTVNLISSIYGKDSNIKYTYWIQNGLLKYIDNTKIKELTVRLQLPSTNSFSKEPKDSSYTNNLLTKTKVVNLFTEDTFL